MLNKFLKLSTTLILGMSISGCATIGGWLDDDEEKEIRQLPEITMAFETEVVWSESVGDGVEKFFSRLTPAVAYGKIFAADRQGEIVALNPDTGKRIWSRDISRKSTKSSFSNGYGLFAGSVSAKISGGLTAAYNAIYFGTEDGVVYSLNEADGSINWQTNVPSEVIAAPAADANIIVVNTVSGSLMGLDALTGEVKWQNDSDVPPLTLRGISAPTASAGGAIVGLANGRVRVSIIDTGLTAWESEVAKPTGATELDRIVDIDSKPLVFGGTVFLVSYGGSLAAIELRSGNVIWTREYASFRNVSIDGNRLFVTDNNSSIYAIDRRNGVELWSNGELRRRNLTAATPVGDYIAVGDKFGYLHYFTQDEGKYVSRIEVGRGENEAIYNEPVFIDGLLVVQTRDGEISVLSTPE
ncbi:lipoprotein yfgL [Glaciecola punicea ACAM 611]|jgi:outer membrane protein assembly factor BamB|uniref:Outer membrane protein assembly factor BamB n=1 Tax=Glaciecola punicea ACAM 611 TaxID=1121923 RepID=H5T7X8_9ALTE|nr:outer membrane protein assembly factor BamB [Glaciecola punicea]OFA30598.1 outer membrane protein assembly factor BamB [Glaciecola punicea]GAB54405.1 lipoprotein yfgL [Glaciecola punicea ACAM 611]